MRSTRRLLDRFRSSVALTVVSALGISSALASCASEGNSGSAPDDAGADASSMTDAAAPDSGSFDATTKAPDAAPFDGGPLPVVCGAPPCATSLVTSLPAFDADLSEGFCALLDNGTVACWGANGSGQLGRGVDGGTGDSATAARVAALSDIVQLDHTCARDRNGGVWCWGTGPFLRSDGGAATTEQTAVKLPLPPAKNIAMSARVACAVVDDELLCWGLNAWGQIAPIDPLGPAAELPPRAIAIPAGAPIRDVLVGTRMEFAGSTFMYSGATYVRREDGEIMSWGGSLWGASAVLGRVSSLRSDSNPRPIALDGVTSMDVTSNNACAVAGGRGHCWGCIAASGSGCLVYDSQSDPAEVPTPVVTPEPIVQIATTRDVVGYDGPDVIRVLPRWCAVGASGAVYCWGTNTSGQAGDGTKEHAYNAVKVVGLPERAVQVKTMPSATCALLTNGKVYCWGANYYGQLGNGKMRVPSLVPQEVVLP
jgi:Regulator of chromosome condensation (RCC1) repeat